MTDTGRTPGGRGRMRRTAAVALAACVLLSVDGWTAAAAPGRSAVAAAVSPAPAPYERIALQTLEDIVDGDFEAATARFDATLRAVLSPDALAEAWDSCQETFGRYQSHGKPTRFASGELSVVDTPLRMEDRPATFRLSFHKDGSIAGLWFLDPGVPVP
ncbi:DUF3887 domain-containing protein [Streptomyces sp. NPDC086023]|uniref:DUF3887 domain-containing protein n=1 Tax=Streptomyces sp. NPDC086023 TaxID=3365746 RepID=UPI0037D5D976